MKRIFIYIASAFCLLSCESYLDRQPDDQLTSENIFEKRETSFEYLVNCYTYIADESHVGYRMETCGSDEASAAYQGNDRDWALATHGVLSPNATGATYRSDYQNCYYGIHECTYFLANIDRCPELTRNEIDQWKAEARFLRAYAYSHAIDFYNKMPFVDENSSIGANIIPETYDRSQMFSYIVEELSEIAPLLEVSNYGHATRGAAYALLARVCLNSEVYTGSADVANYNACITACRNAIECGYSLESDYGKIFNADNHLRSNEIIFALACDATHTTTWDATTFITCGEVLSNFDNYAEIWGTENSGAWNNLRARPDLVDAFQSGDTRARFISYDRTVSGTDGSETTYTTTERSKDITAHDDATTGYRICKWTNLNDAGEPASDCSTNGANTDFPVLRLADVYLMLAEAVVRGGTEATMSEALSYVNLVRQRAFGSTDGNIGQDELTLDFLCQERLREMYMECIRRTDLIRFGKYTSGYNWQWKANVYEGADVDSKYRFLPIPEAEYSVNPQTQTINNELGF